MVATRRMAHKEPDMLPHDELSLRKKPVRKATAKKADAEPPKPRGPRGRKAAPSPTVESSIEDPEVLEDKDVAVRTRSTRKTATRVKEEASSHLAPGSEALKATQVSHVMKTRIKEANNRASHELPVEEKRVCRTRATAAKAQPLSPKKITQVAKPQTRTQAACQRKAPIKTARVQGMGESRMTRKRNVSDENAGAPGLPTVNTREVKPIPLTNAPMKRLSFIVNSSPKENAASSTHSACARPNTASDWPRLELSELGREDEHEDDGASISNATDSEDEDRKGSETSDDELAGPKTPLKRSSRSAHLRYLASVHKTIQQQQFKVPTPSIASRIVGNGTQAQKLEGSENFHECELRSPVSQTPRSDHLTPDGEELSFCADVEASTIVKETKTSEEPEKRVFATLPSPDSTYRVHHAATPPDSESNEDDEQSLGKAEDSAQNEDPDATIIVDDDDKKTSPSIQDFIAEGFEESILITRDHSEHLFDMRNDGDDIELSVLATSHSPETLIWENVRQDVTIPVNFDQHFADIRTLPQLEATERLNLSIDLASCQPTPPEEAAEARAERDELAAEADQLALEEANQSQYLQKDAVDLTMNLNDFIDVAALAEPTQALSLLDAPAKDEIVFSKDGSENVEDRTDSPAKQPPNTPIQNTLMDSAPALVQNAPEEIPGPTLPHYALSTVAFDARRKSLPILGFETPAKANVRPSTSDGTSVPRTANNFQPSWWTKQDIDRRTTHSSLIRPLPATVGDGVSARKPGTPIRQFPALRADVTPVASLNERYPRLNSRHMQVEHAQTAAAPQRFRTPIRTLVERSATVQKGRSTGLTPRASSQWLKRRETPRLLSGDASKTPTEEVPLETAITTPVATGAERFPRLAPRNDYVEHAKTVGAPSRFRSPIQASSRQPKTAQKPTLSRKVALKGSTPVASHTPTKTPTKAPAMTPSQVPMTPHPAAPLKGVTALVEVFTLEGASASAPFVALLHRLGAKTTRTWSDRVTHVVFKDGSPATLQRVRLNNKNVETSGQGTLVHCVNSRWISDCDSEGSRMDESDEAYAIDVFDIPRGGQRRRKSMEPASLRNVGGAVVKGGNGRNSLSRSTVQFIDSPAAAIDIAVTPTKVNDIEDKENSADEQGSPATPAWLHPEQLVQQTAPMNRVCKLKLHARENRRLTFWNGQA